MDGEDIRRTPTTAADVPTDLDTAAGEIVLDLQRGAGPRGARRQDIDLESDVGRIEVIVPPGLSVHVDAKVDGPGHIELFGDERGGIGISDQVRHDAGAGTPEISIDANVSVGEIQVHRGGQQHETPSTTVPAAGTRSTSATW